MNAFINQIYYTEFDYEVIYVINGIEYFVSFFNFKEDSFLKKIKNLFRSNFKWKVFLDIYLISSLAIFSRLVDMKDIHGHLKKPK